MIGKKTLLDSMMSLMKKNPVPPAITAQVNRIKGRTLAAIVREDAREGNLVSQKMCNQMGWDWGNPEPERKKDEDDF